jgi:type II secretory pathway predicted ATPase ExeA
MYKQFYGLAQNPFSLLPDPSFFFTSRQHGMALTLLKYSLIAKHPFTVISGEVGSGKTTLVNRLLGEIGDRYTLGLINFTDARVTYFWPWVLRAYGLPYESKSSIEMYDAFMRFLMDGHRIGRTTVLIVDEAQNLAQKALESLRMLSNVNDRQTLLQLILVGQPEFLNTLRRPDFRQLTQRVSVFYRLDPLSAAETRDYINHRLRVVGRTQPLFSEGAMELIFKASGGIARRINTLCDLSLVYGFASGLRLIDAAIVCDMLRDRKELAVQTVSTPPRRTESAAPLQIVSDMPR